MVNVQAFQQQLLLFIRANVPDGEQVQADTDLLALGLLDSLMVAELFVFVETKLGVELSASDVMPQNFRTVERLALLAAAKQQKLSKAA
jgi:acyl carrier protein